MTKSRDNFWWVYILRCSDGTLYTGVTNDVEKRVASHNDGTGAKYTSIRRPVTLKYTETHENRSEASRREAEIKRLSRLEKIRLISEGQE